MTHESRAIGAELYATALSFKQRDPQRLLKLTNCMADSAGGQVQLCSGDLEGPAAGGSSRRPQSGRVGVAFNK